MKGRYKLSQQSKHNRIRDRRISVFGHVRRLQESVPAHEALRLVVNSHAGHRPDDRPAWKRPRGLEVVPEKPGSASWRSMSVSLQMLLGKGGHNDPSPVKRSS